MYDPAKRISGTVNGLDWLLMLMLVKRRRLSIILTSLSLQFSIPRIISPIRVMSEVCAILLTTVYHKATIDFLLLCIDLFQYCPYP